MATTIGGNSSSKKRRMRMEFPSSAPETCVANPPSGGGNHGGAGGGNHGGGEKRPRYRSSNHNHHDSNNSNRNSNNSNNNSSSISGSGSSGGQHGTTALLSSSTSAAAAAASSSSHSSSSSLPSSSMTHRSSTEQHAMVVLQSECEALKSQLDHERSLRELDSRRAAQAKQRLERQVQFAAEEADEAKNLLDDVRREADQHVREVRQSRQDALKELRSCQHRIVELEQQQQQMQQQQMQHGHGGGLGGDSMTESKVRLLQQQLQARADEVQALQEQLKRVSQEALERHKEERRKSLSGEASSKSSALKSSAMMMIDDDGRESAAPSSSHASKPLMKELNRVRLELADRERQCRQLVRQKKEWGQTLQEAVHQKEAAKAASIRVSKLESQVQTLSKQVESQRAVHEQWQTFSNVLHGRVLKMGSVESGSGGASGNTTTTNTTAAETATGDTTTNAAETATAAAHPPPEVSTVLRHIQKQLHELRNVQDTNATMRKQLESAQEQVTASERQSRDTSTALSIAQRNIAELEEKLRDTSSTKDLMESRSAVWKREREGLEAVINTYDAVNPRTARGGGGGGGSLGAASATSSSSSSATVEGLQVSLQSAREDIALLLKAKSEWEEKVKTHRDRHESVQAELDRVKSKFVKLRDALQDERTKASEAEDRAAHAEHLAGKGAYNPDTTRILHLEGPDGYGNPLWNAMRERYQSELNSLRRRLEQMTGDKLPEGMLTGGSGSGGGGGGGGGGAFGMAMGGSAGSGGGGGESQQVDPDKLHQRLKDQFRDQINIFREGVYLITGYKMEMHLKPAGTIFRARSVFAEREEDYLEFLWPKKVKEPTMLDLIATDYSRYLSTASHSFSYLKQFNSCPAFVASAQLELFEKCTVVQQQQK